MPTLPALDAPTQRPNEPVTHGLPIGAGAGTDALTPGPQQADDGNLVGKLTALYRAQPNEDVRRLLQAVQAQNPLYTPDRPGTDAAIGRQFRRDPTIPQTPVANQAAGGVASAKSRPVTTA